MIADPRMCPASTNVAWIPGAILDLPVVVDGPERGERPFRILGRVERRIEVDLEVRRLGAKLGLGVARPGPRCGGVAVGLDGGRDVVADHPIFAVLGEGQRGLVTVRGLAVLCRRLRGIALLPARIALGELLVELAGVQQDERREFDRPGGGVDRTGVAGLDQDRQQPAVVEVGVGQQDGVERRRVEIEGNSVANRLVGAALEHPAVDEDPGLPRDEQVLRPGDGGGATEEVDLHAPR